MRTNQTNDNMENNGGKKDTFAGFAISLVGVILWTILMLLFTYPLWALTADPFALARSVCRIMVIVPLAAILSSAFVKYWDMMLPNSWVSKVGQDPIASAIALGVLIYSVFQLSISG